MKAALLGLSVVTTASWSYIRNSQLPLGPYRKHWGSMVFGHRGCRFVHGLAENTVEAFVYAKEHGAAGIECDVRVTRDGQAVVFHDECVGNNVLFNEVSDDGPVTTLFTRKVVTPKTRIRDLDLMEVKCLLLKPYRAPNSDTGDVGASDKASDNSKGIVDGVGLDTVGSSCSVDETTCENTNEERNTINISKTDKQYSDVFQIPTLEETVLFCRDNNMKLVIEMKDRSDVTQTIYRISELYERYPEYMQKETMVASFFPQNLYNLRVYNRKIPVMILHLDTIRQSQDFPHNVSPLVAKYPELFDTISDIVSLKIAPWMIGGSSIGPRYTLFGEDYKRKWLRRNMNIFVWGMTSADQCTDNMRGDGVIICADNNFLAYYPYKPECTTYAQLFPDAPSVMLGANQQHAIDVSDEAREVKDSINP